MLQRAPLLAPRAACARRAQPRHRAAPPRSPARPRTRRAASPTPPASSPLPPPSFRDADAPAPPPVDGFLGAALVDVAADVVGGMLRAAATDAAAALSAPQRLVSDALSNPEAALGGVARREAEFWSELPSLREKVLARAAATRAGGVAGPVSWPGSGGGYASGNGKGGAAEEEAAGPLPTRTLASVLTELRGEVRAAAGEMRAGAASAQGGSVADSVSGG